MQFRDHPAVAGKRDFYPIDPRKLRVDDSYNVRDMNSKETREHVAGLKASIAANGVKVPLEVRLDDKTVFVVAGHCRLAAVMQLIAEGVEIETVPCIPESKGTSEIDRVVNLVVSNSGKPLAPLEIAQVVKRLTGYGWSEKQIAERLGWKSASSVKQHLEMLELPEPVKAHIRKGDISATTARHLAKSDLTQEQQEELIRANLEENKRITGTRKRSTKVTKKTLKRDAKPPAEPPQHQEREHAEPQSISATAAATPVVQPPSPAPVATPPQPLSGIPENRVEPDAVDRERDQGVRPSDALIEQTRAMVREFNRWTPDEPAQSSVHPALKELKALMEAFAPVVESINMTDLNGIEDDDRVHYDLSGKDAKRLSLLFARATGGEEIAA